MLPFDSIYHPAHASDAAPVAPAHDLPEPLRICARRGRVLNLRRLCGLLFGGGHAR